MRTSFQIITAAAFIALSFLVRAECQIDPFGQIISVNADGSLTIDAGRNVGFEEGDILVIQRDGTKIGLAHIDQAYSDQSTASVMRLEPGAGISLGDLAAYQLIGEPGRMGEAYTPYGQAAPETPPNIMKQEWTSPAPPITDYDKTINNQLTELKKNPRNRSAMIKLADAYFTKGWYKHSITWYQRAYEEKPKAEDNDKILYQIVRAYGYLNEPDNQRTYYEFLKKNYPNSVFVSMEDETLGRAPGENTIPEWRMKKRLEDKQGFQKGGMRSIQKSDMQQTGAPASGKVEDKLLRGGPDLLTPNATEPEPNRIKD